MSKKTVFSNTKNQASQYYANRLSMCLGHEKQTCQGELSFLWCSEASQLSMRYDMLNAAGILSITGPAYNPRMLTFGPISS